MIRQDSAENGKFIIMQFMACLIKKFMVNVFLLQTKISVNFTKSFDI